MSTRESANAKRPIILYDGMCHLCNGSVNFVIRRQAKPRSYYYVPFQSDPGRRICALIGADPDELSSFLLIDGSVVARKSTAWIHIARKLTPLWRALGVLAGLVPCGVRDRVYDFIGRKRYAWFGRSGVCLVPDDTRESALPAPDVLERCLEAFPEISD